MTRGGIQAIAVFTSFYLTGAAFGAVRETRKEEVEVHPNTRMNRTNANIAVTAPVRCAVQQPLSRNAMAADELSSAFWAVRHIHKSRHRAHTITDNRQLAFTLRQS
jgi:hypothetical protein